MQTWRATKWINHLIKINKHLCWLLFTVNLTGLPSRLRCTPRWVPEAIQRGFPGEKNLPTIPWVGSLDGIKEEKVCKHHSSLLAGHLHVSRQQSHAPSHIGILPLCDGPHPITLSKWISPSLNCFFSGCRTTKNKKRKPNIYQKIKI